MRTTAVAALVSAALGAGGAVAAAVPASAAAAPTPIRFAAGATSGSVSGALGPGGEREYTFAAAAGQQAVVAFDPHGSGEHWTLAAPDGTPLHSGMSEDQRAAAVTLPASGTYRLDVQDDGPAASYDLTLTLPVRIRFAPGATSGRVHGSLPDGGSRDYSFDARAGQRAEVTFGAVSSTARWVLVAPDGSPLHTQMGEDQHAAAVVLPATGTYRLQVLAGAATEYGLRLSIPAS